jgi:hypothetical protein
MSNDEELAALKRFLRYAVNESVSKGAISGDDGLAALMAVAATYVAQVDDDTMRAVYIGHIVETFPAAVEYVRTGNEAVFGAAEAAGETRQ